jgi:hypothetical protein
VPVTLSENEKYRSFVSEKASEVGCFDFKPDDIVWHYTDGAAFLGILQSSQLYATQVAPLNDKNETRYASALFKDAVEKLIEEKGEDTEAHTFLHRVIEFLKEDPTTPTHGTSKFFVTCFSAKQDDLAQWDRYGKKNG